MNNHITVELFAAYLDGNLSNAEMNDVEQLIVKDPELQEIVEKNDMVDESEVMDMANQLVDEYDLSMMEDELIEIPQIPTVENEDCDDSDSFSDTTQEEVEVIAVNEQCMEQTENLFWNEEPCQSERYDVVDFEDGFSEF